MPYTSDKVHLRNHLVKTLENKHPSDMKNIQVIIDELLEEFFVYHQELEFQNDELRRIQKELENSQSKLMETFDNAPVSYIITDDLGKIIKANNTFYSTLGLDILQVKNRLLSDFISSDTQDNFYFHFKSVCQSQQIQNVNLILQTSDLEVPVIMSSNTYESSGQKYIRSVFLFKDLCNY